MEQLSFNSSPAEIIVPSDKEIMAFLKRCDPLNQTLEKQADLRYGAKWYESRLKELNPNVNFKTK